MTFTSSRRSSAFTLIELLVVISIISLLISILLPALGAARQRARAISCGSQQRQICFSFLTYANDFDNALPPIESVRGNGLFNLEANGITMNIQGGGWAQEYVGNRTTLFCPDTDPALSEQLYYQTDTYPDDFYLGSYRFVAGTGYLVNYPTDYWFGWVLSPGPPTRKELESTTDGRAPLVNLDHAGRTVKTAYTSPTDIRSYWVTEPSESAVSMDCVELLAQGPVFIAPYPLGVTPEFDPAHLQLGGENVSFADGHVEWRDYDNIVRRYGRGYW